MASLLLGAGALAYDQVQKSREKKKARLARNDARFTALERENADRIAHLQQNTCFCQRSDWRGGGCDVHGYVPPAPGNEGYDGRGYIPPRLPPAYADAINAPAPAPAPRTVTAFGSHRDGGDGVGCPQTEGTLRGVEQQQSEAQTEDWRTRPPAMNEEEIARINENRRKKKQKRRISNILLGGKHKGD
ncbi:MAG: hypothetical protein Q9163_000171 [Psora crenata]